MICLQACNGVQLLTKTTGLCRCNEEVGRQGGAAREYCTECWRLEISKCLSMVRFSGADANTANREPPRCVFRNTSPRRLSLVADQNRAFSDFALHLHTNTIGPIIIAQKLLQISGVTPPSKVVFISSDSGSTSMFRDHEDGFGAYSASKAALNQMLRHMAAELKRKDGTYKDVCVLAMHPGEVQT